MTTTENLWWVKYKLALNLCYLITCKYIMILLNPVFTIFSLQHTLCIYPYLICLLTKLHLATYISWHFTFTHQWTAIRSMKCVYACLYVCVHACTSACLHAPSPSPNTSSQFSKFALYFIFTIWICQTF